MGGGKHLKKVRGCFPKLFDYSAGEMYRQSKESGLTCYSGFEYKRCMPGSGTFEGTLAVGLCEKI